MIIQCTLPDFTPSSFEILNFYGTETCFAWKDEKLVVFTYKYETSTSKLPLIIVPRPIKRIHSYSGRIFIVCKPSGVYKFKKDYSFAMLSASAIETASLFHQVFTARDSYLYFEDKCLKTSAELFQLKNINNNLQVLILDPSAVHDCLKSALNQDDSKKICVLAHDKQLFKLTDEVVQLLYTSLWDITEIIKIEKDAKVLNLLLKTTSDAVIIVGVQDNKLSFKTIHCNSEIRAVTAGFCQDSNENLFIVYSNDQKVICLKQQLHSDTPKMLDSNHKKILCLQNYENTIISLTSTSELIELTFDISDEVVENEFDEFNIKEDMLKGSEAIVESILEKSKELQELNEKLLIVQDKLKRINLFAHQQKIQQLPKFEVERIADHVFLRAKFGNSLPKNTWIYVNLTCHDKTIFSCQFIQDHETVVDVEVDPQLVDSTVNITVDLITFVEENRPWGVIRNCIKEPSKKDREEVRRKLEEKKEFVNSKLNVLRKMLEDENVDMKKLSNIKRSLRREIPDL